jgi:hypothetical protein
VFAGQPIDKFLYFFTVANADHDQGQDLADSGNRS